MHNAFHGYNARQQPLASMYAPQQSYLPPLQTVMPMPPTMPMQQAQYAPSYGYAYQPALPPLSSLPPRRRAPQSYYSESESESDGSYRHRRRSRPHPRHRVSRGHPSGRRRHRSASSDSGGSSSRDEKARRRSRRSNRRHARSRRESTSSSSSADSDESESEATDSRADTGTRSSETASQTASGASDGASTAVTTIDLLAAGQRAADRVSHAPRIEIGHNGPLPTAHHSRDLWTQIQDAYTNNGHGHHRNSGVPRGLSPTPSPGPTPSEAPSRSAAPSKSNREYGGSSVGKSLYTSLVFQPTRYSHPIDTGQGMPAMAGASPTFSKVGYQPTGTPKPPAEAHFASAVGRQGTPGPGLASPRPEMHRKGSKGKGRQKHNPDPSFNDAPLFDSGGSAPSSRPVSIRNGHPGLARAGSVAGTSVYFGAPTPEQIKAALQHKSVSEAAFPTNAPGPSYPPLAMHNPHRQSVAPSMAGYESVMSNGSAMAKQRVRDTSFNQIALGPMNPSNARVEFVERGDARFYVPYGQHPYAVKKKKDQWEGHEEREWRENTNGNTALGACFDWKC